MLAVLDAKEKNSNLPTTRIVRKLTAAEA